MDTSNPQTTQRRINAIRRKSAVKDEEDESTGVLTSRPTGRSRREQRAVTRDRDWDIAVQNIAEDTWTPEDAERAVIEHFGSREQFLEYAARRTEAFENRRNLFLEPAARLQRREASFRERESRIAETESKLIEHLRGRSEQERAETVRRESERRRLKAETIEKASERAKWCDNSTAPC